MIHRVKGHRDKKKERGKERAQGLGPRGKGDWNGVGTREKGLGEGRRRGRCGGQGLNHPI